MQALGQTLGRNGFSTRARSVATNITSAPVVLRVRDILEKTLMPDVWVLQAMALRLLRRGQVAMSLRPIISPCEAARGEGARGDNQSGYEDCIARNEP